MMDNRSDKEAGLYKLKITKGIFYTHTRVHAD